LIFHKTAVSGAYIIELEKFIDERGFFARSWCSREFREQGLTAHIVQSNISYNAKKNTIRGLHYQKEPHAEDKIVQCIQGAILDVVVDLRPESPSFKQWISAELNPENSNMLFVPAGCAHGFQTLENHTKVTYMVSSFYAPGFEAGVRWNDPEFKIEWKKMVEPLTLSVKDKSWPNYMDIS
jgi:dTDP-4-dehydrorhamnose 3,5-epimerase